MAEKAGGYEDGGDISDEELDATSRQLSLLTYDNQGRVTSAAIYRADGVDMSNNVDGVPSLFSRLRARTTSAYDDRGRLYNSTKQWIEDGSGYGYQITDRNLVTAYWYDDRNHVIKQSIPSGPATKSVYDGAGRLTKSYVTDASQQDSVTADLPDDVVSDSVLEQTEYAYDKNGNVILVTRRQRFHNATGTGELGSPSSSQPKARVSFTALYYDSLNRVTRSMDVGTNGGTNYTTSDRTTDAAAARSNTKLITTYAYDDAGREWKVINPRGNETRTWYDLLNRKTKTVEAYTDGTVSDSDDRTTVYTYTGGGNVSTIRAMMPDSADTGSALDFQETRYVYGVDTGSGSAIFSNDLLAEVWYPERDDATLKGGDGDDVWGEASSAEAELFSYDSAGRKIGYIDRRGVEHQYTYDGANRMLSDSIIDYGPSSTVDESIDNIEYAYDDLGRRLSVTGVEYAYDGFGQLVEETQYGGTVEYAYEYDADGNYSRLSSVTHPNGRVIEYIYDGTALDDSISRLSSIEDDGDTLEAYSYLGLGTYVVLDRPTADTALTYMRTDTVSTGDGGDQYIGLDRFGRIVDQRWIDTGSGADIDRIYYSYDRNGNRVKKVVSGSPTIGSGRADEVWVYDKLDRLVEARRGYMNTGTTPWTMTSVEFMAGWKLDTLGNTTAYMTVTQPTMGDVNLDGNVNFDDLLRWLNYNNSVSGLWTDADLNADGVSNTADYILLTGNYNSTGGNAATVEVRTYDRQNRLLTMGAAMLGYDAAGNQITDQNGYTTIYDAWNRPVEVKNGGSTLTTYAYDGLGRRTEENGVTLLYNANWQLLEERESGGDTLNSYVWSPIYIDAMVSRDRDADNSSLTGSDGLEERIYSQWDANFNVTSLSDDAGGDVIERYRFEVYGARTVLNADFSSDTLAGSDGTTGDDTVAGWNRSDVLFRGGHQGGMYDEVLEGEMRFRNRTLDVEQMRWTQMDPLMYVDGPNAYQSFLGNPINLSDPYGLEAGERGIFRRIWDGIKGIFGADGDKDNVPTPEGVAGGIARDVAIDQGIGRNLGRPGQAAGLGACVTVAQGLDAAEKAAELIKDAAYWKEYQSLLEGGQEPERDPLFRALTKIREGRSDALTPEERTAVDERFN